MAELQPGTRFSKGNIKGAVIREFALWHEQRFGRGRISAVVRELEPLYPEVLDAKREAYGLLASEWYPAPLVHTLLDRLTEGANDAELTRLAEDAANVIMGRTLRGVYRTLFGMVASPDRFARFGHSLWGQHYDTGRNDIERCDANTHRVRYIAWHAHHPFICRMNMASSRPIYEAMGCKDVRYVPQGCVSRGSPICENLIRWSA